MAESIKYNWKRDKGEIKQLMKAHYDVLQMLNELRNYKLNIIWDEVDYKITIESTNFNSSFLNNLNIQLNDCPYEISKSTYSDSDKLQLIISHPA